MCDVGCKKLGASAPRPIQDVQHHRGRSASPVPDYGRTALDDEKRVASKWRPEVMSLPRKRPLAQKPAQDSPDRPEAGGGAYPRGNAPATL